MNKWTDEITNIRNWEIWRELQNNFDYTQEDIGNMPLECYLIAGIVQNIIRRHRLEFEQEEAKQ